MRIIIAALIVLSCAACARQNSDYWAGVSAGVAHVEKKP